MSALILRYRRTSDVSPRLSAASVELRKPTIQSAPPAFRPRVTGSDHVHKLTHNVLRVVAHLVQLERTTGRRIKLALEPEPFCFLETTDETLSYFQQHLYSGDGARTLDELAGLPMSEARPPRPSCCGLRRGRTGPMISEFLHVAVVSVAETTYFVVSLKNRAPVSSSRVRVDHDGSNIS
jgi:hypothetical protein